MSLKPDCSYANELRIEGDLRDQIGQVQKSDEFLKFLKSKLQIEQIEYLHIDEKGTMTYEGRLCVPNDEKLRNKILSKAHYSKFTIHPCATKMYQYLKKLF